MKKWGPISLFALLVIIVVLFTPALSHSDAVTADPIPEEQLQQQDTLIVRVYFDDLKTAYRLAASIEPLQAHYEKGYLVLEVSREQYNQLQQTPALRTEIDTALMFELLQREEQPQGDAAIQAIPGYSCYRTVEETFATAASLASSFPTLATWSDVGDSWEKENGLGGYDMMVLRLTNSAIAGPKPKIFITSAIHAREYTTAELMTRLAENLVNGYGTDADATWLLDYHDIHLMLHANPDGRKKAEAGLLWRKNTNQNYCGATSDSRGADLNRNFQFQWGCCGGSSGNECSQTYRGPSAASEPEVQTVQNYIFNQFPDQRGPSLSDPAPLDTQGLYLDIHSSGRLLLWPWGFTSDPAPNGTQLQTLGRKLAYFNGHEPQQSIGLYPTDGTTTSFAYGEMGLAAFTYELGTEFFESCSYFENTLIPDNMPSLMYALRSARAPYMLPSGPDALNLSLSVGSLPPGIPAGTAVGLSATLNDTRYNNSNGTEPTQNIAAAEYYIDTPPWVSSPTPVPIAMPPADGAFNSEIENAQATIDTSSLSEGQHIIFVHGQDAAGNWGVFSAIFLYIDNDAPTPTVTPTAPPPPDTVFFDDFESDMGWVTNPAGSDTATTGMWERANPEATDYNGPKQLGTAVSGDNDLVTGAAAGAGVGSYDVDNGITSMRSPNIALPTGGEINLSFSYYMAHTNNSSSDDFLRVHVVGDTTTTVLEELGAANDDDAAWESFSTSLNGFAGQTIYLLIEAADAAGGSIVEAAIDDVWITSSGGALPTPTPTGVAPTPTNTPIPPTPTNTPIPPTPTNTPQPGTADILYVSSSTSGNVGFAFRDEDILRYDTGSDTWTFHFDGSDVGLETGGVDINAFHFLPDNSILMSFSGGVSVPGVGTVDDSDIVRFIPSATGPDTAGSYEWYFDGSDVGLSTSSEDVDAISVAPDGRLLISTAGSHSVSGTSGSDEDLLAFTATQLGSTTSGSWVTYFDGSDVGLSGSGSEDVWGTWVDDVSGEIFLTTAGSFSVTGVSGDGADIFTCAPLSLGGSTSCDFGSGLFWEGSAHGFGSETMDSFVVERP